MVDSVESQWFRRMINEFKELEANPPLNVSAGPITDDWCKWVGLLLGPKGTPYQDGEYFLDIKFPKDYPLKPPQITFATKIYHCDINDKGRIGCDILKDNWSPALTLSKVLTVLMNCFVEGGNSGDPLVPIIARQMEQDLPQFVKIAAQWNQKYADGAEVPSVINAATFQEFLPWQEYHANKDEILNTLKNMGFEHNLALNAYNSFPNDLNSAVTACIRRGKEKKEEKKEDIIISTISGSESSAKHFHNFLEEINMEKYFDNFQQNDCCDMNSIQYFDNETLREDIEIKSNIARKKFLGKCNAMKQEMNQFKNGYGISSILYKQLAKFGVVTVDILCVAVKSKSDIKNKYGIENDNDCDLLWNIVERDKFNAVQNEGNNANHIDLT